MMVVKRRDNAMKVKEFVKLENRLLPDLPGFAIKRSLMFMVPVGILLRTFADHPSGFEQEATSTLRCLRGRCSFEQSTCRLTSATGSVCRQSPWFRCR